MDLREIRTTFLEKKLAYACSYYARLRLAVDEAVAVDSGVRAGLRLLDSGGEVFDVLDRSRVVGADGHDHDIPKGPLETLEESIVFQAATSNEKKEGDENLLQRCGMMDGRMTIVTKETKIAVTYNGLLELAGHPRALFSANELGEHEVEGKAFIVPSFETSHPKYHWLVERVCIAFGVWKAASRDTSGIRAVHGRFDVYSAS